MLFPNAEIVAWIEGDAGGGDRPRPAVLAGSHDPLLDWAARESDGGLAMLLDGSADGLERFAAGEAALAGLHIPDDEGWNIAALSARGVRGCVLIGWASRSQGLILGDGLEGARLSDLRGRRVALRQEGAGARALFDRILAAEGMSTADFVAASGLARTESEAAAAVASSEADAAFGLAAMARQYRLGFTPLAEERFDLLIDRRSYFTEPVQRLLAFAATPAFAEKAAALSGYDVGGLGAVRWLSP